MGAAIKEFKQQELEQAVVDAEQVVTDAELTAQQEESEAAELEMELRETEELAARQEAAEEHGRETERKISEVAGA